MQAHYLTYLYDRNGALALHTRLNELSPYAAVFGHAVPSS
jgi:hypothetical protein